MSVHDGKKAHKCTYCIKSFTTAFSLKRHLNKFHPKHMAELSCEKLSEKCVTVFKCEICCNEFKNLDTLKNHFDLVHQGKNIHFSQFGKERVKIAHERLMPEQLHKCEILCEKTFSDSTRLKNHIKNIHECESCGKLFSLKHHLERHIYTIHEGHKDHKCELCDKACSQAGDLKRHVHAVHEGHKDYKCDFCGKSFTTEIKLGNHMKTIHKDLSQRDPLLNPAINKEYNEVVQNNTQMQINIAKNEQDEAGFESPLLMDQVIKTEVDENKIDFTYEPSLCIAPENVVVCDINKIINKKLLNEGAESEVPTKDFDYIAGGGTNEIHVDVKNHDEKSNIKLPTTILAVSGSPSNSQVKNELKKELLKCETCDKSFTGLQGLERHLHTVHDGYKVHKCESCVRSFTSSFSLKRHIGTFHSIQNITNDDTKIKKKFKCQWCVKTFTTSVGMRGHIRNFHQRQNQEENKFKNDLKNVRKKYRSRGVKLGGI